MLKVKRALISVSDKTGLDEFVKGLERYGVEILSTGGTAKLIEALGINVRKVSDFTASPEMLDGRVKTLHPKIHGGLLAIRDNAGHMKQVKEFGIELIDMVVVNLYPFRKTVAKDGVTMEEAIENIDIGGPSMLRSAAKNYRFVAVVSDPARYKEILANMDKNKGKLDDELLFTLAKDVFKLTSVYDNAISGYLEGIGAKGAGYPSGISLSLDKVQDLRYGENPHQRAAFYRDSAYSGGGVATAKQLHGKELSFNNIIDLNAAIEIASDFEEPAAVVIKHTNPCGAATADKQVKAYKDALKCDPLSAFGSIVGFNRAVDEETAKALVSADFVECVIAPGYSKRALSLLTAKKNLRIIESPVILSSGAASDFKRVIGGFVVQDRDTKKMDISAIRVVTKRKPSKIEMKSLLFGWKIAKHVKSNAIVLTKGTRTVGVGAGQMSRVDSVMISARKAGKEAKGSCLASDAFFPKADGIQSAKKAGAIAIIQPGGSIRDEDVIKAADKAGMAMVFTGMRHFKH
ncbi:MAG: bifunctional phosphoribosylaminoimidazolecarboxamide formyltransferase/IMP cyclohydrolase [Candidatus Omnitrophica bacterium CG1_02_49_10]|nr:MAG: bifunctional phosphoribosylaminoimidazolecarboxamide formyltransferase/IMP cyclohydrolase [Candidatus Omnitrophica bacterium CG1_02_49_10]